MHLEIEEKMMKWPGWVQIAVIRLLKDVIVFERESLEKGILKS